MLSPAACSTQRPEPVESWLWTAGRLCAACRTSDADGIELFVPSAAAMTLPGHDSLTAFLLDEDNTAAQVILAVSALSPHTALARSPDVTPSAGARR